MEYSRWARQYRRKKCVKMCIHAWHFERDIALAVSLRVCWMKFEIVVGHRCIAEKSCICVTFSSRTEMWLRPTLANDHLVHGFYGHLAIFSKSWWDIPKWGIFNRSKCHRKSIFQCHTKGAIVAGQCDNAEDTRTTFPNGIEPLGTRRHIVTWANTRLFNVAAVLWFYEHGALGFHRKGEAIERGDEDHGTFQLDSLFGLVHTNNNHADDNDGFDNGTVDGMTQSKFPNQSVRYHMPRKWFWMLD